MSDREWNWQNATGCSTPEDANRIMLEQSARLRQKDETIKAMTEMLEQMTYAAVWLHDEYRKSSNIPSDGTHEAAFNRALALVEKARRP